jgi:hypothetical protein
MNLNVGIPPNQVNLQDTNVSDYRKFEAAKEELVFCMYMAKQSEDVVELKNKYQERSKELTDYLNAQMNQNSPKKGCYIATMAYGSYEHPKVLILRNFRDNTLSRTNLGIRFISTYYKYSPKLVEILKNKKNINSIIRIILNQICVFLEYLNKTKI